MELHQLRYTLAVAKYQSFTKAAEEINVSQSSLSIQISKLETELGTKLFERGARVVTLTAAGNEFLQYAEAICLKEKQSREMMKIFGSPDKGFLKLGICPGAERYDFFRRLANFNREFSGVQLDLHEFEGSVLIDMLLNGEINSAFCCDLDIKDNAEFYSLYNDELALIVPPDSELADKTDVSIEELHGQTLIFSDTGSLYNAAYSSIITHFHNKDIPMKIKFLRPHNTGLLSNLGLATNGFGLHICSAAAAMNYVNIGYKVLKIIPPIPRVFGLATTPRFLRQPFVANFVKFIQRHH